MDQVTAFMKVCTRRFKNFQLNFTSLNNVVFVYLTLRFLTDGVEEFLIQPTAWYYMKYLGESDLFLGFILAAFSTTTFIFSPLFGIFDVKYQASKAIVVMSGLLKFFGNLLYSIPVNGYFPLSGRFISGVGESTAGVLFGAVAKGTKKKNRAKAFIYFQGLWCVGTIFGPTIGSVLTFNINILGWEINAGNSPGLVLTIVWVLLLMLLIFLPSDLAENAQAEDIELCSDSDKSDDEQSETEDNTGCALSTVCFLYYLIFLRSLIFYMVSFYIPLLAVYHVGLGLRHVKLFFVNSSLFGFCVSIATDLVFDLRKISEKKYLFIAGVSMIVPVSIVFYFAIMWNNAITVNAAYLLFISMIIVSGQFVTFAITCTFLSKITLASRAAFYQSLTYTTLNLSVIIARLIAGATFLKIPMMCNCLGHAIAWAIGMIWFAIEYKNLPLTT